MTRKIILFSSSYIYLTLPQFKALIPELVGFKKILLNVKDLRTKKLDNNYIKEKKVDQIFDRYIKLKSKKQIRFDSFKSYRNYKKLLTKYLDKIYPDAIISGNDSQVSDRVMFSWCKKKKVPFIILQPSFIDGTLPIRFGLLQKVKYVLVNKILGIPKYRKINIYGNESQKSCLFLWGKYFIPNPKRKRMNIIGNPAFDELFRSFPPERPVKKKAIICTQPYLDLIFGNDTEKKVLEIYLEAIKSKPELEFYVKIHPREKIEKYLKIFPKSKFPNVLVCKNRDLYELFKLCSVQISVYSFTSFEAVAMGVPIIILMPHKNVKFPDHFKGEVEVKVKKIDEIRSAIDLTLSEEYWNEFLKKREKYFRKRINFTDGKNAKRIAEVIKRIIKKQSFREIISNSKPIL